MITHSEERPYPCSSCHKSFKQKYLLTEHQRVHTGERLYACSECYKSFSQSRSLVAHMKTHSDATPYKCLTCGKGFKHKNYLTVHQRVHTREQPYACPECNKSFSVSSNLSRHIKTHKSQVVSEAHVREGIDPNGTLSTCNGLSSAAAVERSEVEGLSTQYSLLNETRDEDSREILHSSKVPFIVNVKVEEDI